MNYSMMSYTLARQKDRFDLERMLQLTTDLDLAGIDFYTTHGKTPEELRARCADRGIPIVGYIFTADLNFPTAGQRRPGLESVREGVDVAARLGAPRVLIPTGNKDVGGREAARRNWIDGLREAVDIARAAGIVLTVENFPGARSAFVTAADFLAAWREVPDLRLTFDSGNAFGGEDPADSFRRTAPLTVHAHFKDWDVFPGPGDGRIEMLSGRYCRAAPLGRGVVDHRSVLQAMKQADYQGCINIEYEGNEDPYEVIREAVNYLREVESDLP